MSHAAALPQLEIRYVTGPQRGFAVFCDGRIAGSVSRNRDDAELGLEAMARRHRRARGIRRPCLCCSNIFYSEGSHNRMCDSCRQTANAGALF